MKSSTAYEITATPQGDPVGPSGHPLPARAPAARNECLAALPEPLQRSLLEHSERVHIAARTALFKAGTPLDACYFIERGLVSCFLQFADGFASAAAMIGPEGVAGMPALAGSGLIAPHALIAQVPVIARRIPAGFLRETLGRSSDLLGRILLFSDALRLQIEQSVACNLHHNVQQRLARWLLMAFDRSEGNELRLTQESLSAMVGARRASVTVAASALRSLGAIGYRHGRVHLIDRSRLEDISCECYPIVRGHYRRLIGWPEE